MLLKYKITVFVLAIATTFMSVDIFSDNHMFKSVMTSLREQNARIDLFNAGGKENSVELVDYQAERAEISDPGWFRRENGIGKVLLYDTTLSWQSYAFTLRAVGDGRLTIRLMGQDRNIHGRRYPALVDLRHIVVNGKEYAATREIVWHDKNFAIDIDVKDGDTIAVQTEARKHIFELYDIYRYYHTNFRMVLACFIVSCLLYTFLVNMYAKGRSMGGRRADMLFLVVFFVLLCIPMLHISEERRSKAENRNLATYEPIIYHDKFNMNFGGKFDKWFSDRFNGRESIIETYFRIVLQTNTYPAIGGAIYNSRTNWMFNLGQIDNRPLIENTVCDTVVSSLNQFGQYLAEKGAKLYLLIVPVKADVYKKEITFYKNIFEGGVKNGNLIHKIQEGADFPVVFPYEELKASSKEDFVFFKTDHHWTDWGAFTGYQALMRAIRQDFQDVHVAQKEDYDIRYNNYVRSDWGRDFHKGQTARLLGQYGGTDDFLDVQYAYHEPKHEIKYDLLKRDEKYQFKYFKNDKLSSPRAIICGTSMNEDLLQFVPQSFGEVLYIRLNNVQRVPWRDEYKIARVYDKYISEFSPDIFILCLTAENLPNLKNLMNN